MKKYIAIALFVLAPTLAFAGDASLKNTDSSAHELKIKCSSTSTRSHLAVVLGLVRFGS